jgi:hypothetical protein
MSARSGLVPLLALALALALPLAGCSPGAPDPAGPPGTAPGAAAGPLAERHTWGGLCPEGPCTTTLEVSGDGRWTWDDGVGREGGRLGDAQLSRLRRAVAATGLGAPTGAAPGCAADSDGTSVRYGWAATDGWGTASSCEVLVDPADPLVRALDGLADEVDG